MFRIAIKRLISMDRRAPSFSANVIYQFTRQVLSFVVGIGVSIIVARYLGPKGKGILSTLLTFSSFHYALFFLGTPTALQYFIASRKYQIKEIIGTFCAFTLSFYFPLTFLLIILAPYLTSSFLKGVPSLLLRVSLLVSLTGYFVPLGSTLSALRRYKFLFLMDTVSLLLRLALLSSFLIILKWGVWGAFASDWLLTPISIALSFHFLNDVVHLSFFSPRLNILIIKNMLMYGILNFVAGILWRVNARFDVFFVNTYWGASAVGLYMTGVNYTELMRLFSDAISYVLFPQVSSIPSEEARKLTSLLTRLLLLYYLVLAPIIYLLAPLIIPFFFGSAFRPSVSVIPYLLPGIISWMYYGLLGQHFLGRGFPQYNLYGNLTGSIFTILLDFLLIPRWGIIGASIASSIAYTLTFLVVLHFFKKLEKLSLSEIFLPRKNDLIVFIGKLKEIVKTIKGFQKS